MDLMLGEKGNERGGMGSAWEGEVIRSKHHGRDREGGA